MQVPSSPSGPAQSHASSHADALVNPAHRLGDRPSNGAGTPEAAWLRSGTDLALALGLLVLFTLNRNGDLDVHYRVLAVLTLPAMLLIFQVMGVYSARISMFTRCGRIVRSWLILLGLLIPIGFVTKTTELFSREVILLWGIVTPAAQMVFHAGFAFVASRAPIAASRRQPVLLVGGGSAISRVKDTLEADPAVHLIGVVSDDPDIAGALPRLADVDGLIDVLEAREPRRVYLAFPLEEAHRIKPIYRELLGRNMDVVWVPDMLDMFLLNHQLHHIGNMPAITLSETPLTGTNRLVKRAFDIVASLIALIALAPLMLIIAAIIKWTSPGPAIFRQERHGGDGEIFRMYKFRSMKPHEETGGTVTQASQDDDRITPIGRFIRRTSIDELPQLVNVLQGDMSLVGPRPHAVAHNEFYADKIDHYMVRHRIKPGMTGWAQVHGLRGGTETLEKMEARVQYDLAYLNNWSLWLDLKILVRTVMVLVHPNAY